MNLIKERLATFENMMEKSQKNKSVNERLSMLANLKKTPLERHMNELMQLKDYLTKDMIEFDKKFF